MAGRFKLDENVPSDAESLLRRLGHEVETALGEQLGGQTDSRLYEVSRAEERILVTLDLDLDFADIRQYPPSDHPGMWVLRPHTQSIENMLSLLTGALAVFEKEVAANKLWIIEPTRVRIHE